MGEMVKWKIFLFFWCGFASLYSFTSGAFALQAFVSLVNFKFYFLKKYIHELTGEKDVLRATRPLQHVWCWTHGVLGAQGHCPISRELEKAVSYLQGTSCLQGQSIDGPNPEKVFLLSRPSCCTTRRPAVGVYFLFMTQGIAPLQIRAVLIINPNTFAQNSRVSLSLPALNPGACFSSLLINVLCGIIFPEYGSFLCIGNRFRQIS